MSANTVTILKIPIHLASEESTLDLVREATRTKKTKPLFIVTAYSETLLQARKDAQFREALGEADRIVADGVSVVAAADFLSMPGSFLPLVFLQGLWVGIKILLGSYTNRVTGVNIVRHVIEDSSPSVQNDKKKTYKVFLLGGFGNVAQTLAKKYDCFYDAGSSDIARLTQVENEKLLRHIKQVRPDVLLVSFGRFKQEVWIARNLSELSCKVVIGVGSAFDEVAGIGIWQQRVPHWIERMGLKWLWRVYKNPTHFPRAFQASVVFPWLVFLQKLTQNNTLS